MDLSMSVELVNLGKKYNHKGLFQGINAVIKAGQCLGITGSNGSGKTTLLKLIAGIEQPSEGYVYMKGNRGDLRREERVGSIGMVSPQIAFYDAMTGIENIMFFCSCSLRRCSIKDAQEGCMRVGLDGYSDDLVSTYSTGMKQRLKLAIMLVFQPTLWLLDEPSSNLDAVGKKIVGNSIKSALQDGATVIVATNECWELGYASEHIILGECSVDSI